MRFLGSLVVHAVIGAVLFSVARHPVPPASGGHAAVEVVDLQLPVKTIDVTTAQPRGSSGGGGGGAREKARPSERSSTIVASRDTARTRRRDAASTDAFDDPRGAISFDSGDGNGEGKGKGRGAGRGIGFGDGGGIDAAAPPPTPPPAPKLSKARPARLVFPSRQRDVDDGELYIMRVTVDAEGFVAGATLVRGFGGHRDDVAAAQIWRFRYDAARDDDGQPIRSVLEQRFLVQ